MHITIIRASLILGLFYTFITPMLSQRNIPEGPELEIHISSSINYYQSFHDYTNTTENRWTARDLALFFETDTSGMFLLEQDTFDITQIDDYSFLRSNISIGMGVQLLKGNSFHEISLTRLSNSKYSSFTEIIRGGFDGPSNIRGTTTSSFVIGMRYEYGRYFTKKKSKGRFKLGLSLGIDQSYYRLRIQPILNSTPPIRADLYQLELSLIPILNFKFAERARIEFKIVPNLLLSNFGKTIADNQGVEEFRRSLTRVPEFNTPELHMAFSLLFKYDISKEKDKRRRGG